MLWFKRKQLHLHSVLLSLLLSHRSVDNCSRQSIKCVSVQQNHSCPTLLKRLSGVAWSHHVDKCSLLARWDFGFRNCLADSPESYIPQRLICKFKDPTERVWLIWARGDIDLRFERDFLLDNWCVLRLECWGAREWSFSRTLVNRFTDQFLWLSLNGFQLQFRPSKKRCKESKDKRIESP